MTEKTQRINLYQNPSLDHLKRKTISSRFPLNSCNFYQLKDTWKSIKTGLKHSIQDYNDNILSEFDVSSDYSDIVDDDYWSSDEESIELIFDNDQNSTNMTEIHPPLSELKSSLKQNERSENDEMKNMSLSTSRQIIHEMIQSNFEPAMKGSSSEFDNYVFNMIVQDYAGAEMDTIYNKISCKNNEKLLFARIKELILDKYIELKLDALYDRCLTLYINFEEVSPEIPSLYSQYKDIWIFDTEEYQVYDYSTYKQEMLTNEYSFSFYGDEDYINDYANTGFLMNLEKFYYFYSKDPNTQLQSKDFKITSNEITHEKWLYKSPETSSMYISDQLRTTSIRFSSLPQVFEIDQKLPPHSINKYNWP